MLVLNGYMGFFSISAHNANNDSNFIQWDKQVDNSCSLKEKEGGGGKLKWATGPGIRH